MSLWRELLTGLEYKSAIGAAVESYHRGGSLPEIIRSFSIETEGKFDDQWARDTELALRAIIDRANVVSTKMGEFSALAESGIPIIVDRINSIVNGIKVADHWIASNGPILSETLAKVGVFAIKVKTRAERLNRAH